MVRTRLSKYATFALSHTIRLHMSSACPERSASLHSSGQHTSLLIPISHSPPLSSLYWYVMIASPVLRDNRKPLGCLPVFCAYSASKPFDELSLRQASHVKNHRVHPWAAAHRIHSMKDARCHCPTMDRQIMKRLRWLHLDRTLFVEPQSK